MTKENKITPDKINGLLAFLPNFEQPKRRYIREWKSYYPVYEEDVVAFFRLAGESCWMDTGYKPAEAQKLVQDDQFIAQATLPEIKTMLTYCVRGERFSDGFWASLLENGRVQAILKRLQQLQTQA